MKKFLTILSAILMIGCAKDPRDVLVDDPSAKDHLDKICEDLKLNTTESGKVENAFKTALGWSEKGSKGKSWIAKKYGIKYENLTIGDIIDAEIPPKVIYVKE
jgi:hypothetical protein